MNKILSIIFILIILQGCSFKPMLADKKYDLRFTKIIYVGDKQINKSIKENLINNSVGNNNFEIYFVTAKNKEVVSSNAKGDPIKFKLKINLEYKIIKDEEILVNNSVIKETNYNNIDDKLELSQFEENTINNLIDDLSQEILMSVVAIDS